MAIEIIELHHVNVTVSGEAENAAKHFYGSILGLREISKPEASRGRGGAWYQLGAVQLHLSIENDPDDNAASRRHVCYLVSDIGDAEAHFRDTGIEILPDPRPVPGWARFYVRDPGGNLIEIAQSEDGTAHSKAW